MQTVKTALGALVGNFDSEMAEKNISFSMYPVAVGVPIRTA